jgi:hypothetical protein
MNILSIKFYKIMDIIKCSICLNMLYTSVHADIVG